MNRSQSGFTLIELLVTCLIVGVLAAIALPAYASIITKSKLRGAQLDLTALSLNMEGNYTLALSYPDVTESTDETRALFKGWFPSEADGFTYVISDSSSHSYVLEAIGHGGRMSGYTVTISSSGVRTLLTPDGTSTSW